MWNSFRRRWSAFLGVEVEFIVFFAFGCVWRCVVILQKSFYTSCFCVRVSLFHVCSLAFAAIWRFEAIWSDMEGYRAISSDMERYGAISSDIERYGRIWSDMVM